MFHQLLQSNAALNTDMQNLNTNVQGIKTNMQGITGKMDTLNTKFDMLDKRVTRLEQQQASSSNVKTTGQLPGKSIDNPKTHTIKMFTLENEQSFLPILEKTPITGDSEVQVGGNYSLKNEIELEVKTTERSMIPQTNEDVLTLPKELLNLPDLPVIKKLDDPGVIIISCSIGKTTFLNCMCDLGAATNVMPVSIAEKLGIKGLKPGNAQFKLADQSTQASYGFLKDVPVVVDNIIVPTDFAVMNMLEEPDNPLIFGRPFLATTNALINVAVGAVQLKFSEQRRPIYTIKGHIFNRSPTYETSSDDDDDPEEPPFPDDSEDEELITNMIPPHPTYYPHHNHPYNSKMSNTSEAKEYSIYTISSETSSNHHSKRNRGTRTRKLPTPIFHTRNDPGVPYITCRIREGVFRRCMCDTGANINVMPLRLARFLGFNNFASDDKEIKLGDSSFTTGCGKLKKVIVHVGGCVVITDFVIMDMENESEHDLIFGRPFLAAIGAEVSVETASVRLQLGTFKIMLFSPRGIEFEELLPYSQPPNNQDHTQESEDYIPLSMTSEP